QIFGWDTDQAHFQRPAMVMEQVDGDVLGGRMRRATDSERELLFASFVELIVNLHSIEVPDTPPAGLRVMSNDAWLAQGKAEIGRFEMNDFMPVVRWLEAHKPQGTEYRLTHKDLHPWNILCTDSGESRVIDWSNAGISDYRSDLAWTLLLLASH